MALWVRSILLTLLVSLVLVAAAAPAVTSGAQSQGAASSDGCASLSIPVALAPAAPADQTVAATLCAPRQERGDTLQILVHCATCSHLYWDLPFDPDHYSYVRAMSRAGYPTLNLDRVGIGASSHPDPNTLTGTSQAYIIHQLVQMARAGKLGGHAFAKVVLVGSSVGSAFSLIEAAAYADVDGLVLSSLDGHGQPDPAQAAFFFANFFSPANAIDPRFAGLPSGYLTTLPGTQEPFFFYSPGADPRVIALNEATRQTVTIGELLDIATSLSPSVDASIRVPLLISDGEFDWLDGCVSSCGQPGAPPPPPVNLRAEPGYFPSAPSVEVYVQPQSGHMQTMHRTAPAFYAAVRRWLNAHDFGAPAG